jgi:tRNA G37 N-methylase Trm5
LHKMNHEAEQKLTRLREKRKFTDSDWARRGLIPSDSGKVQEMIRLTDTCLDELQSDIKSNASEKQLRKTLVKGLKRFKTSEYDTEEREFICDEFRKIGAVLGINIADSLNSWLYGSVLGTLLKLFKKKEIILHVRSSECTQCKMELKINITAIGEGIPSYWIIGQCEQCGEYNLLFSGENAAGYRFENFTSTEILSGGENSEEQAKTRLEQIRYFRGKR